MNSLLRKSDLPADNDDLAFADPTVTFAQNSLQTGFSLAFWKKCSVLVVVLVAIIATSGWLYLIAKLVGAFVHWF